MIGFIDSYEHEYGEFCGNLLLRLKNKPSDEIRGFISVHIKFRQVNMYKTKKEIIDFCSTFPDTYEDYPFHDINFTAMRCRKNKKMFALIFEKDEQVWVNIKCSPEWIEFWRNAFSSVLPGYHMNKKHWNSIVLDQTVPDDDIRRMLGESYDLVKPQQKDRMD